MQRVVLLVLPAHQKLSSPRLHLLTDNIVMPLASFTVGLLAKNTEQNLNFDNLITILLINVTFAHAFES